jgi:hypothetical protein
MPRALVRELVLDGGLLLIGVFLLPLVVYLVGKLVFGTYGGDGLGAFFGDVIGRLTSGSAAAWFLVLSPLIVVSILRCVAWGWRASAAPRP